MRNNHINLPNRTMKQIRNIQIPGRHDKDILADLIFQEDGTKKEVVIFCHGYKGYKAGERGALLLKNLLVRDSSLLK